MSTAKIADMATTKNTDTLAAQVNAVFILPRELRDQVYSYLWDENTVIALNYTELMDKAEEPYNEIEQLIPYFANPNLVGPAFAQEAVQWAYEHADFFGAPTHWTAGKILGFDNFHEFHDTRGLCLTRVREFLNADVFRVGITPKQFSMSRLTLKIPVGYSPRKDESSIEDLGPLIAPLIHAANFKLRFHLQLNLVSKPSWGHMTLNHFLTATRQLAHLTTEFEEKFGIAVNVGAVMGSRGKIASESRFCSALVVSPVDKAMLGWTRYQWDVWHRTSAYFLYVLQKIRANKAIEYGNGFMYAVLPARFMPKAIGTNTSTGSHSR